MCACVRARERESVCVGMFALMHACMYVRVRVVAGLGRHLVFVCIYCVCMCVCVYYVYMYVCLFVCLFVWMWSTSAFDNRVGHSAGHAPPPPPLSGQSNDRRGGGACPMQPMQLQPEAGGVAAPDRAR